MPITRDDVRNVGDERGRRFAHDRNTELLQQAAVSAQLLTGSPHWDRFLSLLQNLLEEADQQAEDCRRVLCDTGRIDQTEAMGMKILLAKCEARILTLQAVMAYPKQIIAKAATADAA